MSDSSSKNVLYHYTDDGTLTGIYYQTQSGGKDVIPDQMTSVQPPATAKGEVAMFSEQTQSWRVEKIADTGPSGDSIPFDVEKLNRIREYQAEHYQKTMEKMDYPAREDMMLWVFFLIACSDYSNGNTKSPQGQLYVQILRDHASYHRMTIDDFIRNMTQVASRQLKILSDRLINLLPGDKLLRQASDKTALEKIYIDLVNKL